MQRFESAFDPGGRLQKAHTHAVLYRLFALLLPVSAVALAVGRGQETETPVNTRTAQRLIGIGVGCVGLALLAGCAGSTPAANPTPTRSADAADLAIGAAWLAGGTSVAVITEGSSTCVPTASDATSTSGVLDVTLTDPEGNTACTRDFVQRVTIVETPDGVDPLKPLLVTVNYHDAQGETQLAALTSTEQPNADDGTPSAGWVDDATVALLTYGSSSRACYPQPEEITVSGEVITVSMASPTANTVCTLDFARQGTLIHVDSVGGNEVATLMLTGHGFDNVEVPIIGTR